MKAKGFGLVMTVLIAMMLGLGVGMFVGHGCVDIEERCDTSVRIDTVKVNVPIPIDSVVVRTETAYLPVVKTDTIYAENYAQNSDDFIRDSIAVEVPITQKVYEDSLYKAWVSGFHASLDSIRLYNRTNTITITKTIRKKWSLGLGAGVSLGTDGRLTPGITLSVQRSLIDF